VNDLDQIIGLILAILLAVTGLLILLTQLETTLKSDLSSSGRINRPRRPPEPTVLPDDTGEAD
jgi:hypothetical protein